MRTVSALVVLLFAAWAVAACDDDPGADQPASTGLLTADDLPATPRSTTEPELPGDGSQVVSCGIEANALLDAGYDFDVVRFDGVQDSSVVSVRFVPPDDERDLDADLDAVRTSYDACVSGLDGKFRALLDQVDLGQDSFGYESKRVDGTLESRHGFRVADDAIVGVTVTAYPGSTPGPDLDPLLTKAAQRANDA
jgi:hypothetical protein